MPLTNLIIGSANRDVLNFLKKHEFCTAPLLAKTRNKIIDSHLLTNFNLFNPHQVRFQFEPENSLLRLQSFDSSYTSVGRNGGQTLKMTKIGSESNTMPILPHEVDDFRTSSSYWHG